MKNMTITKEDLLYTSYDWFAVDLCGHIGCLTSGGASPMLASAMNSNSDRRALYRYFSTLRVCTQVDLHRRKEDVVMGHGYSFEKNYLAAFVPIAQKGIFAYDSAHVGQYPQPYILVASPRVPIHVDEIPLKYKTLVEQHRLNVVFPISPITLNA